MYDLEIAATCGLKERWLSRVTPRVVILSETVTRVPAILMEVAGTRDLERCAVVNQMASDLSGFNDMPFRQNQQCNADRQCSSWAMQAVLAADETEMNSCVSSAYCW